MMKKTSIALFVLIALIALPCFVLGQTDADVGDLASFGKEAKFFGFATTGQVIVSRECPWPDMGPDDRCFTINAATNAASFDAKDIGRIYFPPKTFQNVIYLFSRHTYSYYFLNPTTQSKSGRFLYIPYITLESGVLSDPSLINPQTGQPFNGKLDITIAGIKSFAKTILPHYQESDSLTYGSSSTSGLTKKYFMDNFGLSVQVVDNLFYEKMTVRLNIRGTTREAEEAHFVFGVRFIGN